MFSLAIELPHRITGAITRAMTQAVLRESFDGPPARGRNRRAARATISAVTRLMESGMTVEEQIEKLNARITAQEVVVRHVMSMLVGLGIAAKAWDQEMGADGLTELSNRLKHLASTENREKTGADIMTLLAVAMHASEDALRLVEKLPPHNTGLSPDQRRSDKERP